MASLPYLVSPLQVAIGSISRLIGSVLGGIGRAVIAQVTGKAVIGYNFVFGIMSLFMIVSLIMLTRIDVQEFQQGGDQVSVVERAAIAGEA